MVLRRFALHAGRALLMLTVTAVPVRAAAVIELYGTFHAMGVIVTLTAGEDSDATAAAALSYRVSGTSSYQQAFPLSRVSATRFVGSLFWLTPGTTYDVRVALTDSGVPPLDGVTLTASGATRAEVALPPSTHSYIVSPGGSGSTCTAPSPCALTTALGLVQAGQDVVLRGGVYAQGALSVPRSGTAGAPIVIRGYTGETAVLDGGDPASYSWTAQGGGVYQTTVAVGDTHLVVANGQRLYPYQSLADLQALAWSVPGFYANGTSLSVRLAGDANPGGASLVVSRFNSAFSVSQNYVAFVNLTFRYYGQGSYAKALYFNDASDNLVQDCVFLINDLGIGLKRDSHRNVIQDSSFSDTTNAWPWDAVKTGAALETGGIRLYEPMTGRGTVIRRNTFHHYFDGLGVCPETTAGVTNETDVYENLVHDAGDDGMETDGRCSNVRIWENTFHDVLAGISLAPALTGPVYAIRNLVYRTGAGNSSYTGMFFKFNSGGGASGPMFLFHNTGDAVLPANSGFDIRSPGTWSRLYARNNIWSATEYAVVNANTAQPLDLDYDDLWTTLSGELAWWSSLSDRHLNTLAELQAATGLEVHGRSVAPEFVDAGAGNYRLNATSRLVNAGLVIPGINDGYTGSRPDLGAFEFTGRPTFTDEPIVLRATPIKRVHVTELRQAVATLRSRLGLSPVAWTDDPPMIRATTVKADHVAELRAAIAGVYVALTIDPPTYTHALLAAKTSEVSATDIAELRAAVLAVW